MAGVSRTTIQRWIRDDPALASALTAGRQAVLDDAVGSLKAAARAMAQELTRIALHGEREVDRIAAIRTAYERIIPRKQELTVRDESAAWAPVLAVLPTDSAEYRALVALSERMLAGNLAAIPVEGHTVDASGPPGSADQASHHDTLPSSTASTMRHVH